MYCIILTASVWTSDHLADQRQLEKLSQKKQTKRKEIKNKVGDDLFTKIHCQAVCAEKNEGKWGENGGNGRARMSGRMSGPAPDTKLLTKSGHFKQFSPTQRPPEAVY